MKDYYKELGFNGKASIEEVKNRYRELIKKNHPDLYPLEKRENQNLIMININEAYMNILSLMKKGALKIGIDNENHAAKEEEKNATPIAKLKYPAYTYYKLGIDNYVKGHKLFHHRFTVEIPAKMNISGVELLQLALSSIKYYKKSYEYFMKVVTEYSESIWADDSKMRLEAISRLNEKYRNICENITKSKSC